MKFSIIPTGTALLCCAALTVQTVQAQQTLVREGSEIVFISKQMGVPVQGHFGKFDAQLRFDPAKPESGSVKLTIDTGSATLRAKETDAELPKPIWFNVAQFPHAVFESSAIRNAEGDAGAGNYEVVGTLRIKGQAQPLVVPVVLAQSNGQTLATGAFTLKRLAFGIGANEWADTSMLADEVQVKFKFALAEIDKF